MGHGAPWVQSTGTHWPFMQLVPGAHAPQGLTGTHWPFSHTELGGQAAPLVQLAGTQPPFTQTSPGGHIWPSEQLPLTRTHLPSTQRASAAQAGVQVAPASGTAGVTLSPGTHSESWEHTRPSPQSALVAQGISVEVRPQDASRITTIPNLPMLVIGPRK